MDELGRALLKEELKEIDVENKEQIRIIFKNFLESYIKSSIVFGITNEITKDTVKLYRKIKEIISEETKIHNFLRKNALKLDEQAVQELLEQLDDLNDETIEYYFEAFNDILTACDLKNETYAKHKKRKFKALNETDEYRLLTASLLITYQDIKKILNYEEEFWTYIENRIVFTSQEETNNSKIEIKIDDRKNITDISATIPQIIDYETITTALEALKYLYYIYTMLVKKIDDENILNPIEEEQIKQYILKNSIKYCL